MKDQHEIDDVLNQLSILEPQTDADRPRPAHEALAQLHHTLSSAPEPIQQESFLAQFKRRLIQTMTTKTKQFAAAGVILALFVALFSIPSARALASDFLGLFRVQKFAAISISPEQLARLEELDLEGLQPPGEIEMIEEPGRPIFVETLDEASTAADIPVKTSPTLGQPNRINVSSGGNGILTVDVASARAILEIAEIDPNLLPDSLEGADISVTTYPIVEQTWHEDDVDLVQMTSPEIQYPDNFDPSTIGVALLQMMGMDAAEASTLASQIDWTSTLILPVPQEFATFGEVSINGSSGLLLTALNGSGNSLMWEENGIVYMLMTQTISANGLIEIAETLE